MLNLGLEFIEGRILMINVSDVISARKGNKESFLKIIMELKDNSYKIAFCYLGNKDDSMDAVCNAVIKAFQKLKTLKQPEYFSTWFIRIVINECKLVLRQSKSRVYFDDIEYSGYSDSDKTADIKDEFKACDMRIDIKQLLEKLKPLDRLIIYMKYYLNFTFEEIATMIEIPEGTVKSKVYANLRFMKDNYQMWEG
jgi:RNA polymerase sigma-70 factor (ECF subfamily)